MQDVVGRDEGAFRELYARHAVTVARLASRTCRRSQLAEDAAQDAFLEFWRDAGRYRQGTPPASWLLAIVRCRSIDAVRRAAVIERRRGTASEDDLIETHCSALQSVWQRDCNATLMRALARLPDAQREVIELAYLHDLSQSAVARRLGLPLGTVKSRTRLALARLAADPDLALVTEDSA